MFGNKKRHEELCAQMDVRFNQLKHQLHQLEDKVDNFEVDKIKDIIELNSDNLKRLNTIINEVKGMAQLSALKRKENK